MKIKVNPVQFGCSQIICSDRVMAEVLASSPDVSVHQYNNVLAMYLADFRDFRAGRTSMFELCLRSGAKLKVGSARDRFYIYGYSQGGGDTLAAASELRMWYAIRTARKEADKLNKQMGRSKPFPWLTVEWLYR